MPLILAIEPDRRQAALLTSVVRRRVGAELILVDTTERALHAIGSRVPDLVLVPALLSPQDDSALATALRVIAAATDVQMLTIPVLGAPRAHGRSTGSFLGLGRDRSRSTEPEGCDPTVFAEQIASYLERAAEERANLVADTPDDTAPIAEATTDLAATFEEAAGVEPLPPPGAADKSVSIAVEEAVRAMFSNITPETEPLPDELLLTPTRELPATPLDDGPPSAPAAERPSTLPLDAFMTDLEEMSLPVIEASEGGDWAPPMIEESASVDEEREVVNVDLAAEPDIVDVNVVVEIAGSADASEDFGSVVVELDAADVDLARFEGAVADVAAPDAKDAEVVAFEAVESAQRRAVEKPVDPELWTALGIGNAQTWPGLEGLPAESAAEPIPAVARPEPVAHAAKGEREWVELIESLRHDVERLRTGGAKPAPKPSTPRPARSNKTGKPIQDEWGFFDPEQCGFAALLAKLDEVTKSEENVRA
jgi:hypothetical protein